MKLKLSLLLNVYVWCFIGLLIYLTCNESFIQN